MGGRIHILFFIVIAVAVLPGCRQPERPARIAVAFYNCENFFDTSRNPTKDDEEFTPTGKYHYGRKIYEQKLRNIATVLQSMEAPYGPALAGLAEIENKQVLQDLVTQPEIASRHYRFVWFDGPDERGINVALLYDPARCTLLHAQPLAVRLDTLPVTGEVPKRTTRDVLYATAILAGDTVQVFVNHWPSRTDGDAGSRPRRIAAARVLKHTMNSLLTRQPIAKIIVMGDFNDNPADSSIRQVLQANGGVDHITADGLFNPFASLYRQGQGTEVYDRNWNLFDQVMVSGGLVNGHSRGLRYDSAGIYRPDFLTDHHKGREGAPYRGWLGTYWQNGFSDHFPVLLFLRRN